MIRILLVDDKPETRCGLRMRLGVEPDLTIIGEGSGGASAVDAARELQPDVVLMDLRMPGLDGIEAGRRIRAALPGTRVIILTIRDDPGARQRAAAAGLDGFLLKGERDRDLLAAIRGQSARNVRAGGSPS